MTLIFKFAFDNQEVSFILTALQTAAIQGSVHPILAQKLINDIKFEVKTQFLSDKSKIYRNIEDGTLREV